MSTLHPQDHPRYRSARDGAPGRWEPCPGLSTLPLVATAPTTAELASLRGRGIVVYGATGHTGRAVTRHLLDAGVSLTLSARDPRALTGLAASVRAPVRVHAARADSRGELRDAMRGNDLVVQCAALPEAQVLELTAAAIEEGLGYIDVSAEGRTIDAVALRRHADARRRGVTICCGVAPIGGALGEWLGLAAAQWALAAGDGALARLVVAYASDTTPPSRGSWRSSAGILLHAATSRPTLRAVELPPPFARSLGLSVAFGGRAGLVARHPSTHHETLAAPAPSAAGLTTALGLPRWARWRHDPGDASRAAPRFAVAAHAAAGRSARSIAVSGRDPYAATVHMIALVAARVLQPSAPHGVVAASDLLAPAHALDVLAARCDLQLFTREGAPAS